LRHRAAFGGCAIAIAALASTLVTAIACAHPHPEDSRCGAVGTWLDPATGEAIATDRALAGLAMRPIVLLGEAHDNAEHHLWQLSTLAALHALHPDMVVGFESFPRRVQPILDQWVDGELDVNAFLEAVDWATIWGFDPNLSLPLFEFARQNRVPMLALNVDRDFVSRVRREGWAAIPADERQGISDPAAASSAYRESLAEVYGIEQMHAIQQDASQSPHETAGGADSRTGEPDAVGREAAGSEASATDADASATDADGSATDAKTSSTNADASASDAKPSATDAKTSSTDADEAARQPSSDAAAASPHAAECDAPSDACGAKQGTGATAEASEAPAVELDVTEVLGSEDFARFVGAQLTWDRAMAEALATARRREPNALVVGILGRGHVEHRYGVPHQLADLGIPDAATAVPVERSATCEGLDADLADAVFVIESASASATAPPRARLGVMLQQTDAGVQIVKVMEGSVAAAIALQPNDIVVRAAGFPIGKLTDLVEIVQRQAPGTWLPLAIRRGADELEFVAKFPMTFESPE